MSIMQGRREIARTAAEAGGFFWLPCPSCGQEFGGHEWTDVNGHDSSIPVVVDEDDHGRRHMNTGNGICPDCTVKGVGCLGRREAGLDVHEGCEFVEVDE